MERNSSVKARIDRKLNKFLEIDKWVIKSKNDKFLAFEFFIAFTSSSVKIYFKNILLLPQDFCKYFHSLFPSIERRHNYF